MLNVFCVCVGDRYDRSYVHRLRAMFDRCLHIPHTFWAVSDVEETPFERGKNQACWTNPRRKCWGWWNLQEAYSNPWWAKGGPVLYVGLDTVITGDITKEIKQRINVNRLTLLRDFSELVGAETMFTGTYADGVAFVPSGGVPFLWEAFLREIDEEDRYPMHVFNTRILQEHNVIPDFWQNVAPGLVASFKWPVEKIELPKEPIVCFHGSPRPHEVVERIGWVKDYWRADAS